MQLDLSILNVLATTQDGWNWQVKLINKAKGKSTYSTSPNGQVETDTVSRFSRTALLTYDPFEMQIQKARSKGLQTKQVVYQGYNN